MIGLKRGQVRLTNHSLGWSKSFQTEAKKIRNIFGDDALAIEHVGSTAITGMSAKAIIDIAVVVTSLQTVKKHISSLDNIGYTLKEEYRSDRLFFTKGSEKKRTHYLHVGVKG